jgi:hypothetical protein
MNAERSIAEWVEVYRQLYAEVDSRRTPADIWMAAVAHFAGIGEAIRRMHFADLMRSAAHAFCWMCSFWLACERDQGTVFCLSDSFSEVVALKYPLVCGHCCAGPCGCDPAAMDKARGKAARYVELLQRRQEQKVGWAAYSVKTWQDTFARIYGRHIHMQTLESIGFHFLEESGEVMSSIRGLAQLANIASEGITGIDVELLNRLGSTEGVVHEYDACESIGPIGYDSRDPHVLRARLVEAKIGMLVELADTFAWFCSILNKVGYIATNCSSSECPFTANAFEARLAEEYLPEGKPRCPTCHDCPCKCVFFPRLAGPGAQPGPLPPRSTGGPNNV